MSFTSSQSTCFEAFSSPLIGSDPTGRVGQNLELCVFGNKPHVIWSSWSKERTYSPQPITASSTRRKPVQRMVLLATLCYVAVDHFNCISTLSAGVCQFIYSFGETLEVPVNCLGKCLSPIYVLQYNDQFSFCVDASQFRHGMRSCAYLLEIVVSVKNPSEVGWCFNQTMSSLQHRGAVVCRSTSSRTDSPLVQMREEESTTDVDIKLW